MPRPRLGDAPMTATERSARRRQLLSAEVERLRAEVVELRAALAMDTGLPGEAYRRGFSDGAAAAREAARGEVVGSRLPHLR